MEKKIYNSWEDVYQLPFSFVEMEDGWCDYRITDDEGKFAFQSFMQEGKREMVDKINSGEGKKYNCSYNVKTQDIINNDNGKVLLTIRGWGGLTGTGGLNLPFETAAKIQDGLGKFIENQLNK